MVHIQVKDVNEFAPTFKEPAYKAIVTEGKIYDSILQVEAIDEDCSPQYSQICNYEIVTTDVPFAIDRNGECPGEDSSIVRKTNSLPPLSRPREAPQILDSGTSLETFLSRHHDPVMFLMMAKSKLLPGNPRTSMNMSGELIIIHICIQNIDGFWKRYLIIIQVGASSSPWPHLGPFQYYQL